MTRTSKRRLKKWRTRADDSERSALVHAAGCVFRDCSHVVAATDQDFRGFWTVGIRVPRSLRRYFGGKRT